MPEEERTAQRAKIISYIMMVMIFAGLMGASVLWDNGGEENARLIFHNEGYMTFWDSEGAAIDLYYSDLVSVEFYDEPDFGAPVTGGTVDNVREGLWRSGTFGEYTAAADTGIACCILIRTERSAYAVNYESADATKGIYKALLKVMDNGI